MKIELTLPDGVPDSEVSVQFLQGMVDRMAASFFKYGAVADAYPRRVSAMGTLADQLERYEATGNMEALLDSANYLQIEWMRPAHHGAHFRPTDGEESLGRRWQDGGGGPRQQPNVSEVQKWRK